MVSFRLEELGDESYGLLGNRSVFKSEQEKLDIRAERIAGLRDELNEDRAKLNGRRKENEQRLRNIRREIAQNRTEFARAQKSDARYFAGKARDIERMLDEADKAQGKQ